MFKRKGLPSYVEMEFAGGLRRRRLLMLGYRLPAASTARQWLDLFHDDTLLQDRPTQGSFIPMESPRLAALSAVGQRVTHGYVAAVKPANVVTLDVDAHLVESSKRTALRTHEGFRGYQPLLVQWAETNLILADQLRDGPSVEGCRHRRASKNWWMKLTIVCLLGKKVGKCR